MSPQVECRLYSAWFCPYAQRCWSALNHLNIPYEKIEALTLVENDNTNKNSEVSTSKPETDIDVTVNKTNSTTGSVPTAISKTEGYKKHPRLLELNPKGLVPTMELLSIDLIEQNRKEEHTGGMESNGIAVFESLEGMDFLGRMKFSAKNDESPITNFTSTSLFSEAQWANKAVCSPFYRCLVPQEKETQDQGWCDLQQGLKEFCSKTKKRKGTNWPTNPIDIVDLTVFPWIHRLYVLEHYRGYKLSDNSQYVNDVQFWYENMKKSESIQKTLASDDDLLASYARYARGTAQSLVGEAVRQGKEAHEI